VKNRERNKVNLIVLVYIAVIIVFIFIRLKKQKQASGRKARVSSAPRAGRSPETFSFRERTAEQGGNAGTFSGNQAPFHEVLRKILGEESLAEPAPAPASTEPSADDVVEAAWREFRSGGQDFGAPEPAQAKLSFAASSTPATPAIPATPVRNVSSAPQLAEKKLERQSPVQTGKSEGFSSRLARLGPLQQAIVMAEVLGKPKALKSE
jgi:hypothetical protein